MQDGMSATVAVIYPGHVKIEAIIVAKSEAEAEMLNKLVEEMNEPANVEHTAVYRNGALHFNFELQSDSHVSHLISQLPKVEEAADDASEDGEPSAEDLDAVAADPNGTAPNVAVEAGMPVESGDLPPGKGTSRKPRKPRGAKASEQPADAPLHDDAT